MRRSLPLCFLILLASCGQKPDAVDDFHTRDVTLPGARVIKVETMMDQIDMMRGMMFRTSIAPDHGMLFVHQQPGHYTYWMYQTLIPLDMIWLDSSHNVVEIAENAQPCKTQASKCPKYGGKEMASYVLELGGGMAKKYGLKQGDTIGW
jgi:uncharacterized membrane protein (UPF0127 family)